MGDVLLSRLIRDIPSRRSSLTKAAEDANSEPPASLEQQGSNHATTSCEAKGEDLHTSLDFGDLSAVVRDCTADESSPAVTMRVCCGQGCSGVASGAALLELEELCQEYALPIRVARTRCLGMCKVQGPNVGICSKHSSGHADLHSNIDSPEVSAVAASHRPCLLGHLIPITVMSKCPLQTRFRNRKNTHRFVCCRNVLVCCPRPSHMREEATKMLRRSCRRLSARSQSWPGEQRACGGKR